MNGLIEGKKYVLSTPVDTVITDVKYNIPLGTVKAGQQYVFQAVSDAVTVADGCTIRPFEGSNGASVGVVGGSGDGGSGGGGSSAYPGWVGYIEYDDETGEAIAADYSGLEMGGRVPDSLSFQATRFRGDWNGSIGKFTDGYYMFYQCTNLTSFTSDLSSFTNGQNMFASCSNLTSFTSDLSSLTNGFSMFSYCSNLTTFSSDLSSLTNGNQMFTSCSKLTSFNSDLPSLTDGSAMFSLCKLDAPSVERILTTIPEYTDGSSHLLSISVQRGEAVAKFSEITGATPTNAGINVNFKGWTIQAWSN